MTISPVEGVIIACALVSAIGFGLCASFTFNSHRRRRYHKQNVLLVNSDSGDSSPFGHVLLPRNDQLHERILRYVELETRKRSLHPMKKFPGVAKIGSNRWMERLPLAGLKGSISVEGFCSARLFLAFAGCLVFGGIGSVLSFELSLLLGLVGFAIGWRSIPWSIEKRIKERVKELEHHLSEMLDVVALGLRSGLSFDRSLKLYVEHFPSLLSSSLMLAQEQWVHGLLRRDEALYSVAASYDSSVFGRVVQNIVRSLRFGSSLAESLEAAATEARLSYRACRQEEVAKAPVKMMVPTGVLILPAMLILVLGPVLLDLIGGF